MVYYGPTRPGTSVSVFRATGRSVAAGSPTATKILQRLAAEKKEVARKEAVRKEAERKTRLEAERKARLEAERKARLEATEIREREQRLLSKRLRKGKIQQQIITDALILQKRQQLKDEAIRRGKPFTRLETQRFLGGTKGISKLREATKRERQRIKKGESTIRKEILEAPIPTAKDIFIEERVIDTFRIKGKEIPITKIVIVDEKGKIIRKPTKEEEKVHRESQRILGIPEKLTFPERIEKRATELRQKKLRGKADLIGELELMGLTAGGVVIGTGIALTQLPKLPKRTLQYIKKIIKDPASIKEIPEALERGGAEFGELLRVSPTEAVVKIGTEYALMRGIGKALKITGGLTSKAATKLSPKFKGVSKRAISIPSLQKGKTITIKVSSKLGRGTIPTQLKIGGKRVTAVSAQADRLVKFIKTRKVIRKPIPGEAKLTKTTRKLLKKFDTRKITSKELINLDRRIRVEAKKGLLERSFFADPDAVVRKRFLRLGTEKEASLMDALSGDVTFKTTKPQILIFEKVKVQTFPKTKMFKSITRKLKTGKALTQKEGSALIKFQLKKTGKFKPLGFQTTEMEVTLAPGEIVKKGKTVAVTLIDGKRVPIVRATVIKAKPTTKRLLTKAKKGKLTASELKILRKNLKKETGFRTSISDSMISKPRLPLGRKAVSVAIKPRRRPIKRKIVRRPPKRVPKRPPKKIPKRKIVRRPPKRVPRRVPKRVPRRVPKVVVRRRPPIKPPVKPPVKPIIRPPKKKKIRPPKKKPKVIQGYNVYGKHKRKFIKLNVKPLSEKQALDRGAFSIDKSTANTFKTEGIGKVKKLGKLTKGEKGHFSKTRKKYRGWKIRKGKRITLKDKFIEKRGKPRIDTRGEVRGLTLAKFAKQKGFTGSRTPMKSKGKHSVSRNPMKRSPIRKPQRPVPTKRKASPAQLAALAKGRKILAQRRKG